MLNIMQGPPGAGKSYEAVNYHIVPALKGGCIDPVSKAPVPRQVITNLPVNVDVVRSVLGDAAASHLVVVPERPGSRFGSLLSDYKSSWRGPDNRGPLFVIDEAHKCVGTSGVSQDVLEWYAEHRHYGADVLLITQAHGKLHRQLVDMCQILFRTRKAIGLGTTKAYVRKVQDGPKGAVLSTEVRRYTFKGYAFYKSHTHSDSAVNEAVTSDVRSIWRQWPFLAAALVLPFAVYLIFHNRHNLDIIHPAPPMATFHAPVPVARAVPITTGAPGPVTAGAPVPVTAGGPVPVTVPAAPLHPFSGIPAHVLGEVTFSGRPRPVFMFSPAGQSGPVLSSDELETAGYSVQYIGHCMAHLQFSGQDLGFVVCDQPNPSSFSNPGSDSVPKSDRPKA